MWIITVRKILELLCFCLSVSTAGCENGTHGIEINDMQRPLFIIAVALQFSAIGAFSTTRWAQYDLGKLDHFS